MLAIKQILLPIDFSEFSKISLPYAIDLAKKFKSDIHIIHVFDENILDPYYFSNPKSSQEFFQHVQNDFQKTIDSLIEDFDTEGINIIPILANGTPFVEIIRYSKKEKIDLIIISTHGRSGLSQMLIGGTAEKIIRKAPCPVLTVRHPEFEFEMP